MKKNAGGVNLLQLVAVTYLMVSGGPFGLEDVVRHAGYGLAILILLITPVLWSIPTAFMVGELASALPYDGGYYVWVRRALGPFWGFMEAWLSLTASVFEMGIYPTLFVAYAARLFPVFSNSLPGLLLELAVIALCALWNLLGARKVGELSLWAGIVLLIPFAAIVVIAIFGPPVRHSLSHGAETGHPVLFVGILIAMWNYMGWDNASTIAAEVENPQKNYPRAMLYTVAIIASVYVVCVAAAWRAGIEPSVFTTGGWAAVGNLLAGNWLAVPIVVCGCISTLGIFNSLVMSYSRVPVAMAANGLLPKAFQKTSNKTGAPRLSIVVCSIAWAFSLGLSFEKLITLDILLYGASLILEFAALIVLRFKEPHLVRPFKVPGGVLGLVLVTLPPTALIGISIASGNHDRIMGLNLLWFGLILAVSGGLSYWLVVKLQNQPRRS